MHVDKWLKSAQVDVQTYNQSNWSVTFNEMDCHLDENQVKLSKSMHEQEAKKMNKSFLWAPKWNE